MHGRPDTSEELLSKTGASCQPPQLPAVADVLHVRLLPAAVVVAAALSVTERGQSACRPESGGVSGPRLDLVAACQWDSGLGRLRAGSAVAGHGSGVGIGDGVWRASRVGHAREVSPIF